MLWRVADYFFAVALLELLAGFTLFVLLEATVVMLLLFVLALAAGFLATGFTLLTLKRTL